LPPGADAQAWRRALGAGAPAPDAAGGVSLSVVIPAYNEEEGLERTVSAACQALGGVAPAHEIVVVDDASTDRTGALADALARQDGRVRVIHHERNRTLGAALRSGFAAARGELVFYTDADLPVDLRALPIALALLEREKADLLAGYRLNPGAAGRRRALYTWAYNRLVRAVFGLEVRDVNFAFKLFRRRLLEGMTLKSEGSFIDAELLLRARRAGARLVEMGVEYVPRRQGSSKLSSPFVIAAILRELLALRAELS
jgi:glycosyltransferase involved in cell wall biosynthesis